MKNKLFARCLIGAPIGLTISMIIAIAVSLAAGDGQFYPVVPELIADCGTEINAVVLQAVCSLLYGAAWAGASLIWEQERWSILRQTATHLIICSVATFPVAYFMRWMSHSVSGIISYFAIFFGVYLALWLFLYSGTKKKIATLNSKVQQNNRM